VAILIIWQLHLMLLNDTCVLTVVQEKLSDKPAEEEIPFIDTFIERFTGKIISSKAHYNILTSIFLLSLTVALIADIAGIRIHIF
jgi:hypothetical protein